MPQRTFFLILGCVVIMLVAVVDNPIKATLLNFVSPQKTHSPLEESPVGILSSEDIERVAYQENASGDFFHGPCPITRETEAFIFEATKPLKFQKEEMGRSLEDLSLQLTGEKPIFSQEDLFTPLKTLFISFYKFQSQSAGMIFGLSGASDYLAAIRVAICDCVAQMHYAVQGGIDSDIDEMPESQDLIQISEEKREALKRIYRSCKMTTRQAYRFEKRWFTRVAYLPTKEDELVINKVLGIDPNKADEVICTYKHLNPAPKNR